MLCQKLIHKEEELKAWVQKFIPLIKPQHLILLKGPLGSGKTTLVKYLIKDLNGDTPMSPSFTLHNVYHTKKGRVDHIDLYRIQNDSELETLGIWELFEKNKGLIIVEWADKIKDSFWPYSWPQTQIILSFEKEKRKLVWKKDP